MRGVLTVCLLVLAAAAARADEVRLAADARTALQLTLYQGGFAYIQDMRTVTLPAGGARVAITGVSPLLVPQSVLLRGSDGVRIGEIAYALERLSVDSLLRHAVGRTVDVVRTHPTTGADEREPADVLSAEGGIVLRYRERIETGVPGRLVLREIPDGLTAEPALIARTESARAGEARLDLGYLSEGLAWSADYAIELDEKAGRLALSGRALLTNTTGIDFPAARVALVAGEVQRRSEARPAPRVAMAAARMADGAAPEPAREDLADLHLFALPAPLDLPDRATKQVPLQGRTGVAFTRSYESVHAVSPRGGEVREPQAEHPEVGYAFRNDAAGDQAMPLPAGIARLYASDKAGTLRPIGEDRIANTPVGADVRLAPGRAFDLTVVRRQTAYQEIGGREGGAIEMSWQIDVANAGGEDATVRVVEVMPGGWSMLAESAPHDTETARRPVWPIKVPAGGSARLDYRVRLQR